jgi:antitoxin HigA-1
MQMFNPCHPGELIIETIQGLREITGEKLPITEVAAGLGITRKTLSSIINEKQSITPVMAIRLAAAFNTTPELWLRLQANYDLAQAREKINTDDIRVFWQPAA